MKSNVGHPQQVVSIVGHLQGQQWIGADTHLLAIQRPAPGIENLDDRVELRPDASGEHIADEDLVFLERETEVVGVLFTVDLAIERYRQRDRLGGGGSRV